MPQKTKVILLSLSEKIPYWVCGLKVQINLVCVHFYEQNGTCFQILTSFLSMQEDFMCTSGRAVFVQKAIAVVLQIRTINAYSISDATAP